MEALEVLGADSGAYAALPAGSFCVSASERGEVFSKSKLGLIEIDLQRRITYANPAALKMLGTRTYVGLSFDDLLKDPESIQTLLDQVANRSKGLVGNYPLTITRLDNKRTVPVEVTGVPMMDTDSRVIGSLGVFRSRLPEVLAERLHALTHSELDPEVLLDKLGEELRTVFDFDLMFVSRFSADQEHLRRMYPPITREPGKRNRHWWRITPVQRKWMEAAPLVIEDFPATMQSETWSDFWETPDVQALIQAGFVTTLRCDIRDGGALVGSLSLFSTKAGSFRDEDASLIRSLPVDTVVLRAMELLDRKFIQNKLLLNKAIARAQDTKTACRFLARELVATFEWSHVSIFYVDHSAGVFRLMACEVNEKSLGLDPDYTQPMDVGLLAQAAAHGGATVHAQDVLRHGGYHRLNAAVKSELCVPVRSTTTKGKVDFLINVEDVREGAFSTDELTHLEDVSRDIAAVMGRIRELTLYRRCFECTSDPIFVASEELEIGAANSAAAAILGYGDPTRLTGLLTSYFDAPSGNRLRETPRGQDPGDLVLLRTGDLENDPGAGEAPQLPVHVSRRDIPDFHGSIYVVKDLRSIRRAVELEVLSTAAYQVSLESAAMLDRATRSLQSTIQATRNNDPDTAIGLQDVLRQLDRVRDSYLRLATFNADAEISRSDFTPISLGTEISAYHDGLPEQERRKVLLDVEAKLPAILGAPYPLRIVIDALTAPLVRVAPKDGHVTIRARRMKSGVALQIEGQVSLDDTTPGEVRSLSQARSLLGAANKYVDAVLRAHGGTFDAITDAKGRRAFELAFKPWEQRA